MRLKDLANKPSKAVKAMIEGIEEALSDEKFVFQMAVFGAVVDGMRYGCAATATICKLTNVKLHSTTDTQYTAGLLFRASNYRVDPGEMRDFEMCINEVRAGG